MNSVKKIITRQLKLLPISLKCKKILISAHFNVLYHISLLDQTLSTYVLGILVVFNICAHD